MQSAMAWEAVLASLPGSWLLERRTMPAFMRSSKLHLALFRARVALRFAMPLTDLNQLFLREAIDFSPMGYRILAGV